MDKQQESRVFLGFVDKTSDNKVSLLGLRLERNQDPSVKGDVLILGDGDYVAGRLWDAKDKDDPNSKAPAYSGYFGKARIALWRPRSGGANYLYTATLSDNPRDKPGDFDQ